MGAASYNHAQHTAGRLTDDMIGLMADELTDDFEHPRPELDNYWDRVSRLVLVWQSKHDLVDDGYFGRDSLRRWQQLHGDQKTHPVMLRAVEVAIDLIGQGEELENNAGEFCHRLRRFPYGDDYHRPIGNWCAFFVNYCIWQASQRMLLDPPMPLTFFDKRFARQLPFGSAKWHARTAARLGVEVKSHKDVMPGDLVSWERGRSGSYYGHIEIVEHSWDGKSFGTVGGNVGRFPAKVKRRRHRSAKRIYTIGRLLAG